jgi:hypothetical protein
VVVEKDKKEGNEEEVEKKGLFRLSTGSPRQKKEEESPGRW